MMELIGMQGETTKKCEGAAEGYPQVFDGDRCSLLAGMVLLCCPAVVHAAEWSIDPTVSAALGYESNVALTTAPHEGVSEVVLVPGIGFRRASETSAVDLGLLGSATRYSDSSFDNNEGRVALTSFLQSTERLRWGLDATSRWDTLFRSAVIGTGTGNIQDVDIGLVNTKVRRNWREVTPSVAYALTERSSVTFGYRLTDVHFKDVGTTGLVDYQQHYVFGTYAYRLTTVNDLNVIVRNAQYRPAAGIDSDTTGLLAGISHKFSETASAGVHAGASKTTQTRSDGSQTDTSGFVLEAQATQQSELSQLAAVISGDVQPTGIGQSMSVDQLRADWSRKLSPITVLRFRTKVFRAKALTGSDPLNDRRYAEAAVGANWILAPEWTLGVNYQYRYQKYDVVPDPASSSGVFIGLTWAPPRQY